MKPIIKQNWITWAALLLSLPTAYFILVNVLYSGFGVSGPSDAIAPFLQRVGINESLGWNINLLILFGPLVALILCLFQILGFSWQFTKEQFEFQLSIRKRWFPILVGAFSVSLLSILFFFLVGENCNCQTIGL